MSLTDALILGIVQGLTEFLPVSSSGHLILAESYLKLDVESLKSFDIALHVGTLLAILIYFRKDILNLLKAFFFTVASALKIQKKKPSEEVMVYQNLILFLIIATLPAIVGGLLLGDLIDEYFRNQKLVAVVLILFSFFFIAAELWHKKYGHKKLSGSRALFIGIIQALALIPGVSRSGSTISGGLFAGLKRDEAARFSFLLGAIAIFAAASLTFFKMAKGEVLMMNIDVMLIGMTSSFVVGLAAISFLMKFLKKHTLISFAIYRILFGILILSGILDVVLYT